MMAQNRSTAYNCTKIRGGGIFMKLSLLSSLSDLFHNVGVRASLACVAATLGGAVHAAEWYGTSLDAEGHAQWNNQANWESTTGVPVGNINFTESVINGKSGSKTVYLDGAYTFSGDYHLYAGTEESPLVFKASGSNGFAATANKQMYIGSGAAYPAYVVLDGGTYTFMNDLKPGWNMSEATLVVKNNTRVQFPHWFRIADGNSTPSTIGKAVVRIEGGEVVCGWRNNAESDNSCFILGDRGASRAEFIMTDGRITCGGANNEPAMRFGRGTGSEVSALISGGLLEAKNTNGQVLIGGGTDSKAIVNMTGGIWSSAGDFRIASDGARGYAVMTNDCGTVTCGLNFAVGAQNGTDGTYVHKSGVTTISGTAFIGRHGGKGRVELSGGDVIVNGAQMLLGSGSPLGTSTVALNGGTLSVKKLAAEGGTASVVFNGGTLKALASNLSAFVPKADNFTLSIGERGATVDTANYIVGIESDIGSAVEEGETDGGLVVTGKGILALHAAANYNGLTKVEQGVLDFRNGMSFTGPVEIGKNGAITVEVTPVYTAAQEEIAEKQAEYDAEEVAEGQEHQVVVPTVADLLLNKKIALFSASALSFEEATDDITTSVFLTGPVVGYTLSSETADGRTTVYATITDVANIATSRKVTTFIAGPLADGGDRHVDQNTAYSNGQPANNSFDVVVYPGDAFMYIWADDRSINNRAFGDLVLRGGTLWVTISNANYPNLAVKHVAGNGTLKLARVGLCVQNHTTLVVDEHVNVEASTEGVANTQDVWIGGADRIITVNGDVYVTNGVMKVQAGVTFNGDVAIGYYQPRQSWLDVDGTVFNGDLILEDGATFNCNGKTAVFGKDARLVLKGGTLINTSNITAWPKTVIQGGVYAYGAVPGAAEYTIEGGKLNVVPTTDESGATMTLTGVTLADGVNAEDVIQMAGTNFKWRYTIDETTGVITAEAFEALDSSVPNEWIGGAQGMWKQASNWTRGIPTIDQTVVFNNDAVCFYAEKQDVWGAAGLLDLNGHSVTIAASNYDIQYWGGLRIGSFDESETGTLNIWKAGIWNKYQKDLEFPATMKLTVTAPGSDCWIREDYAHVYVRCPVEVGAGMTLNLDYRVHLYGGLSGSGNVTARYKSADTDNSRYIGGDWSHFTGTYKGHGEDRTVFQTDFAGSEDATWNFPQYFRFEHMSGTVKFGKIVLTNDRHIEVRKDSTLVIEIGGNNSDSTLSAGVTFYENSSANWGNSWAQGSSTVTIKKVGTGILTSNLVGAGTIQVAEGTCVLSADNTSLAVSALEGATLTTSGNKSIGALTLAPGAIVKETLVATTENEQTTYFCPVLTVTGDVNVSGVKFVLEDPNNYLTGLEYNETTAAKTFPVLSANSVTGAPATAYRLYLATSPWFWKAVKSDGDKVVFTPGKQGGFMLIVQ